jgi:hypothetical protein
LLFFKERFLAKDHPDCAKMNRCSAKLRKLGLREETIGYGPSKEEWERCNRNTAVTFIAIPIWTKSGCGLEFSL